MHGGIGIAVALHAVDRAVGDAAKAIADVQAVFEPNAPVFAAWKSARSTATFIVLAA